MWQQALEREGGAQALGPARVDGRVERRELAGSDFARHLARHLAELALELTDSGLVGVVRDQLGERGVRNGELTDGETVLVDRGWLPYAANASVVPAVPPPPSGSVTITGWVRQGESSRDRNLPGEQLATINLAEASAKVKGPLLGGYLLLDGPTGVSDAVTPQALGRPDLGLGPHLAYAYQWWFSVPMGFVLIVLGLRRERRLAAQGAPGSGQPQAESGRPKKKVRIWDEEDA